MRWEGLAPCSLLALYRGPVQEGDGDFDACVREAEERPTGREGFLEGEAAGWVRDEVAASGAVLVRIDDRVVV